MKKYKIYFEVEYKIKNNAKFPSNRFIKGCLLDLEYTHGLKCKNVVIKEE